MSTALSPRCKQNRQRSSRGAGIPRDKSWWHDWDAVLERGAQIIIGRAHRCICRCNKSAKRETGSRIRRGKRSMFRSKFIPSIVVGLAVLLAGPASAQTVSGLVAAYGFEEGSGTAVGDASGSNNNGVASGTTWSTAGKFGNALVFNGISAQVTIPDAPSLRLTTAMTLEAWVFPTTAPTGWRAIVDKNVDGYYLFASTDNGNRPSIGGTWTAGNQNTFGPSVLPVNTWTHLASTFDGSVVRLFVNGVQVASQAQAAALQTTTATLQIGADAYSG